MRISVQDCTEIVIENKFMRVTLGKPLAQLGNVKINLMRFLSSKLIRRCIMKFLTTTLLALSFCATIQAGSTCNEDNYQNYNDSQRTDVLLMLLQ